MNYNEYKSNCHTHSTFCDGRDSIMEMAEEGAKRGFVSLGFSGHSPIGYPNDWAMRENELDRYINEVKAARQRFEGQTEILLGIELDNDTENLNLDQFDYVINSIHTLNYNGDQIPIDTSAELWQKGVDLHFGGDMIKAIQEYYGQAYISAIRPHGDIVGHFDLVTKFNHTEGFFDENSKKYLDTALLAVDGVCDARPDIIFEVNSGAMPRTGKKIPYPALPILKRLNERNMRLTVTSDCHDKNFLEIGYDISFDLIRMAGFKSIWRIRKNGFEEISL